MTGKGGRRFDIPVYYLCYLLHSVCYVVILLMYLVPGTLAVRINTLAKKEWKYQCAFLNRSS